MRLAPPQSTSKRHQGTPGPGCQRGPADRPPHLPDRPQLRELPLLLAHDSRDRPERGPHLPKLSVQTVDYFRAMVDDPFLFGQIAANHALGDIYAMGGEPQSALAIATVPFGLETKVEADLSAMLLGANKVLRAANCAQIGRAHV